MTAAVSGLRVRSSLGKSCQCSHRLKLIQNLLISKSPAACHLHCSTHTYNPPPLLSSPAHIFTAPALRSGVTIEATQISCRALPHVNTRQLSSQRHCAHVHSTHSTRSVCVAYQCLCAHGVCWCARQCMCESLKGLTVVWKEWLRTCQDYITERENLINTVRSWSVREESSEERAENTFCMLCLQRNLPQIDIQNHISKFVCQDTHTHPPLSEYTILKLWKEHDAQHILFLHLTLLKSSILNTSQWHLSSQTWRVKTDSSSVWAAVTAGGTQKKPESFCLLLSPFRINI